MPEVIRSNGLNEMDNDIDQQHIRRETREQIDELHANFKNELKEFREISKENQDNSSSLHSILKRSLDISKKLILLEANSLPTLSHLWDEATKVIEWIWDIDTQELSKALLQEVLQKFSDIIGYDFEVFMSESWEYIDEFWNTWYKKNTKWVNTIIWWDYTESYWQFSKNWLKVADESLVAELRKKELMRGYNAKNNDINNLISNLNNEWKAHYEEFPENDKWPVLIIFSENHSNWKQKATISSALVNNQKYLNFSTMESRHWEATHRQVWKSKKYKSLEKINMEEIQKIVSQWGKSYRTTYVLEILMKENIRTIWVDIRNYFKWLKMKKRVLFPRKPNSMNNNPQISFMDAINVLWEQVENDNTLYGNLAHRYRNQMWLKNIQTLILNNVRDNERDWKNFVGLSCWRAHTTNLKKVAKERWFKWVIVFDPTTKN